MWSNVLAASCNRALGIFVVENLCVKGLKSVRIGPHEAHGHVLASSENGYTLCRVKYGYRIQDTYVLDSYVAYTASFMNTSSVNATPPDTAENAIRPPPSGAKGPSN